MLKNEYEIIDDYIKVKVVSKYGIFCILVDLEDLPRLEDKVIGVAKINPNGRVYFKIYHNGKGVRLHRFLMNCNDPSLIVDHIFDFLDNRKNNLRIGTHALNNQNMDIRKDNKSGTRGVTYWPNMKKSWYACLKKNNKKVLDEFFATKEEAIAARIEAELKYHEWSPLHEYTD